MIFCESDNFALAIGPASLIKHCVLPIAQRACCCL